MFPFGEALTLACRRCAKPLADADFEFDRALILLGRPYCAACLKDVLRKCQLCRKWLRQADFEAGRALTLGNNLYCDGCLEEALRTSRPATVLPPSVVQRLQELQRGDEAPVELPARPRAAAVVAPQTPEEVGWESRRTTVRFVPPLDCNLSIRKVGIRGLLGGNTVRLWVDVSEGGLRSVIEGRYEVGDEVRGRISHSSLGRPLGFRAQVRHCKPSEKYSGCSMVGIRFETPSALLVSFIRDVLGRTIAMISMKTLPSRQPTPRPRSA
jgi:hypothetical protein